MKRFKELGIAAPAKGFVGDKIKIARILNKEVMVEAFKIEASKFPDKGSGQRLCLQLMVDGEKRILFTSSGFMMEMIKKVPAEHFPFLTTICEINEHYEFS